MSITADQPELMALAQLAAVPASKMAAAFNTPLEFFEHLSLEELDRIQQACHRLSALSQQLAEAIQTWTTAARDTLEQTVNAD